MQITQAPEWQQQAADDQKVDSDDPLGGADMALKIGCDAGQSYIDDTSIQRGHKGTDADGEQYQPFIVGARRM